MSPSTKWENSRSVWDSFAQNLKQESFFWSFPEWIVDQTNHSTLSTGTSGECHGEINENVFIILSFP